MNNHPNWIITILIIVNPIILWFLFYRNWQSLAKLYKTNQAPPHNIRHMRHGYVGWIRYKGTLNVGITPEGIYLSVMPIFSMGSSPILIPWRAVDRIEKASSLFVQSYRLHLKNTKTTIVLNKEDLEPATDFLAKIGIELL